MWYIQECEIREATLDTGARDLPPIDTHAVFAGDTCLINATCLCDFASDPFQLLICHCGQPGCATGGYVSFRRIGNDVVWIPAFSLLASDDEFERTHYAPPDYLMNSDHVGAVIASNVYTQLRAEIEALPSFIDLPPLLANDVVTSIQIVAPLQVLGVFPQPAKLNPQDILAVTDGDTGTEIRAINSFIQSITHHPTPLAILPSRSVTPVEFHLDGPGFPAWNSFVRLGNQIGISLQPLGVLVPEQAAE